MACIRRITTPSGLPRWDCIIVKRGHKAITKRFTSKVLAERWARAKELELEEARVMPKPEGERRTLGDAIRRYERTVLRQKAASTQATDSARLAWWRAELGAKLLSRITAADIKAALDKLAAEGPGDARGRRAALAGGVSSTTSAHYLKTLRSVFNVAIREWLWLKESPADKLAKPKPRPGRERFLSEDEEARLLAACREATLRADEKFRSPFLYPIVLLLLTTGARFGEVAGLRWRQVDFARRQITLEAAGTKGRRGRALPLSDAAAEELRRLKAERATVTELVFASPADPSKPVASLKTAWAAACKRAGIRGCTLHDLRHSYASKLVMRGVSLSALAELLGHRSLEMTQRYSHLAAGHALEEARRALGE